MGKKKDTRGEGKKRITERTIAGTTATLLFTSSKKIAAELLKEHKATTDNKPNSKD